jgi:hypothetical protein
MTDRRSRPNRSPRTQRSRRSRSQDRSRSQTTAMCHPLQRSGPRSLMDRKLYHRLELECRQMDPSRKHYCPR